ncbi:flagellar motor protein MotD [compost metagenome]
MKWLVDHGIDRARLRSAGIGMERPLASNDDEVGRQKNRRVEFHIKQDASAPADSDESSSSDEKKPKAEEEDLGDGSESTDDPANW